MPLTLADRVKELASRAAFFKEKDSANILRMFTCDDETFIASNEDTGDDHVFSYNEVEMGSSFFSLNEEVV